MKLLYSLILTLITSASIAQNTTPKKLLIYYGFPSMINGATSLTQAANEFQKYDYVIWPDNIENAVINPIETPKTESIYSLLDTAATKVFGYVSLSMKNSGPKLSQSAIQQKLDGIANFGLYGVLFDECGYTDTVSRARLDSAVKHAHLKKLKVMANTLNPHEVFSNANDPAWNSSNISSPFTPSDFYLFESHTIINGRFFHFQGENNSTYDEWLYWRGKSDSIRKYENLIGLKTMSVTTPDYFSNYDESKFHFSWFAAWLNGHEAAGWGEKDFSSDVPSNPVRNVAPYRNRPMLNDPGKKFISEMFFISNNDHIRYTNRGKIRLNTYTKTFDFSGFDTLESVQSGAWNNTSTWQNGLLPEAYFKIKINSSHKINVPSGVTAKAAGIETLSGAVFQTESGSIMQIGND